MAGDPVTWRGLARAMGVPEPPDQHTVIKYMMKQPLQFTPGEQVTCTRADTVYTVFTRTDTVYTIFTWSFHESTHFTRYLHGQTRFLWSLHGIYTNLHCLCGFYMVFTRADTVYTVFTRSLRGLYTVFTLSLHETIRFRRFLHEQTWFTWSLRGLYTSRHGFTQCLHYIHTVFTQCFSRLSTFVWVCRRIIFV